MLGRIGLSFDDVLLVPRRSSIKSRKEVDTRSRFTRKIWLNIPIVSAAMDTVTESRMAITMAREGGIGVIHRFMPPQRQAEEVSKVKRAENIVIEKPATIRPDATIKEARDLMGFLGISGLLVVDDHGKLLGIITRRDVLFEDDRRLVKDCMTPRSEMIVAREGVSLEEAREIFRSHKIEKLPIVDDEGRLKGLITSVDLVKREAYPNASRDSKGRLLVAAAVGVKEKELERAQLLVEASVDALVVDVAHGHSEMCIEMVRRLRMIYGDDVEIVAGNVATREGVEDLASAGASAVKVGIGPGSVCTTRVVAGVGVPQLTAIMECAEAAEQMDVPIIADGGIRESGDVVKAIAAGASTVMIGRLLAGTDESPGAIVMKNGRRYKIYRGMASMYAMLGREFMMRDDAEALLDASEYSYYAEGVEAYVPYVGSASDVVKRLVAGLRSGMSYLGARNLDELRRNAIFIRISPASIRESYPHDVEVI
ncbi:MAG: IMP dehydrogenase [Thaumarchaeota archaeon]|nr:IMP dehydrogenase [Nitrososphaerota archaeon]MCL7386303.1 IMP dehydrogenase [Candidatus Wolframiiraptor allenii]MCL7394044.1 IMP dehydrogenase [Candidatus Wolframiiraptor allenii]